jgi:hypothetical protein
MLMTTGVSEMACAAAGSNHKTAISLSADFASSIAA